MEKNHLFAESLWQLKKAADLSHQAAIFNLLKKPQKIIKQNLVVKLDNGQSKNFLGIRVQNNNALGPYKGGLRFHPNISLDEMKSLSLFMTLKSAVIGIPFGGGKGGIKVDPKQLSLKELERLTRRLARALAPYIGPRKDIPAPDVNTNAVIMAWFADEYGKIINNKKKALAVVTGKPIGKGGSEGREEATAYGGFYVLKELLKKIGRKNRHLKVIVQGFGNVGAHLAFLLFADGFKIIGLSDSKNEIMDEKGFDPNHIMKIKKAKGLIDGFYCRGSVCDHQEKKHHHFSNNEILTRPCDILIPAALENAITEKNAKKIKAKIVLEMANGAITPKALGILHNRKIIVVPDILANAGGVTVSYFEWKQNLADKYWTKAKVLDELGILMRRAFAQVWQTANKYKTDLKTAAYILALEKINKALKK
ncbi:MAG: Glu/Leu/Phe/Val dehydrogenase [Patescibacteria group bacterium]